MVLEENGIFCGKLVFLLQILIIKWSYSSFVYTEECTLWNSEAWNGVPY